MTWHIFAIVSLTTASIANVLERVLMKKNTSDPIMYAIIFQFMLGIFALITSFIFRKFILPPISEMPLNFIVSGVLWAGSTVFGFYAVKKLTAGEVTILISSASLVSIVLGVVLLHESLRAPLIIGTVCILASVWIIYSSRLSFSSRSGIIYSLLAALCSGVAVVNDAFVLKRYEAFSYTAVMSFLPGIILMMLFSNRLKKIRSAVNINFITTMAIFCFFYTVQAIAYYVAFQTGAPVSQLSPLVRSSVVLTVILAAIFLKERSHLVRKIIAAMLMMVGVILLG